jgi:uroporphyrinogen decarboxylase
MADTGAKRIFMEDDTDYAKAKQLVGKRVTCMMAYIRTDPLLNGTPEEIASMAKDIIKIAAPGGGFILTAGVLPIGAPESNCAAVMEAVRKYGKYPINL